MHGFKCHTKKKKRVEGNETRVQLGASEADGNRKRMIVFVCEGERDRVGGEVKRNSARRKWFYN